MRGRPWLKILLVICGFIGVAYPVWFLTQERQVTNTDAQTFAQSSVSQSLDIKLTFSSKPRQFILNHLDTVLLRNEGDSLNYELKSDLIVPLEGIDLLLKATFQPTKNKHAVRVEIKQSDDVLLDQTFWTSSDLVELVTIPFQPMVP